MTNPLQPLTPPESFRRSWIVMGAMVAVAMPSIVLRLLDVHPPPVFGSLIFGIGILGAAFLLSWGAETAEMDISQGLALAVIAFIAVLPEYAVDFVLAWKAGADPAEAEKGLAVANMTGGNRLLIGIGWPLVFALFYYRLRRRELLVDRQRALELAFLTIATLYVIFIPLRHAITLIDTIILVTLFGIYLYFTSKAEGEEVELVGPARAMGGLPTARRRWAVGTTFVFSAVAIIAAAEPFADALVEMGQEFGVSEFLLIQWLAPLASESPEVLVAGLLAWRGRAAKGMGALISSKVNQWTLLIGTLPLAFMLSSGDWGLTQGLPLDDRQREEIFLTAAQSAFAIAVFINLRMNAFEATALFVLFATQLFIDDVTVRMLYGVAYTILCVILLVVNRMSIRPTVTDAWNLIRGREIEGPGADDPVHGPSPPRS